MKPGNHREFSLALLCAVLVMAVAAPAPGTVVQWVAIFPGDWDDDDNWDRGLAPLSWETAHVANGGTAMHDAESGTSRVHQLYVHGWGSQQTSKVSQSGGWLRATGDLFLGKYGSGSGVYELTGGDLLTGYTRVGDGSQGKFQTSGGTHDVKYSLHVGTNSGIGRYELSDDGELLARGTMYVGGWGTGTFVQTGGTNTVTEQLSLGTASIGAGTYTIRGDYSQSTALTAGALHVAPLGGGMLVVGDDEDQDATTATIELTGLYYWGNGSYASAYFGDDSTFTVQSPAGKQSTCTMTMTHSDAALVFDEGASGTDLAGLEHTTMVFESDEIGTKTIEAAGVHEGSGMPEESDFNEGNFVLDKLVVGKMGASHASVLSIVDDQDNRDGDEAVYVNILDIKDGGHARPASQAMYFLSRPGDTSDNPRRHYYGDLDCSGFVGQGDLDIVLDQWGKSGGDISDLRADANADRFVGMADLDIVLNDWGKGTSPERGGGRDGGGDSRDSEGGGGDSGLSVEIVEVDNSSVEELADYVTQDIVVTSETDWLSAQLILETDQDGDIYQDIYGSDQSPNPLFFALFPALEFDTYVSNGTLGATVLPSGPVDLYGGECSVVFDDELLQIGWSTTGTETGELPLVRVTIANDATGEWSFVVTASPADGPKVLLAGEIVDGEMIPDE